MPAPRRLLPVVPVLLAATLLAGSSGCFLVAAGAGAGAAVAYTNRGASGQVAGTVDGAFARATSAFTSLGIAETGRATEDNGTTRRLEGKTGETEVTVEIRRRSDQSTAVEVVAKKNVVDYDKELAKRVLEAMLR